MAKSSGGSGRGGGGGTQGVINRLVDIGGSEWQKGDKHRVYFDTDTVAKSGGLNVSYYNTGNVSSATLDGDKISNSSAKRILADLQEQAIFYDVTTQKFVSQPRFRGGTELRGAARDVYNAWLARAQRAVRGR